MTTEALDAEQLARITSGMRGIAAAMRELNRITKDSMSGFTEAARHLRQHADHDEPTWEDAHRWRPGGESWRP